MTDQPIPDRSDDLTSPPKLETGDAPLATGNGDPATSDAGPLYSEGEAAAEFEPDAAQTDAAPSGDAPKPSPDI
jgi:hypothetical protein